MEVNKPINPPLLDSEQELLPKHKLSFISKIRNNKFLKILIIFLWILGQAIVIYLGTTFFSAAITGVIIGHGLSDFSSNLNFSLLIIFLILIVVLTISFIFFTSLIKVLLSSWKKSILATICSSIILFFPCQILLGHITSSYMEGLKTRLEELDKELKRSVEAGENSIKANLNKQRSVNITYKFKILKEGNYEFKIYLGSLDYRTDEYIQTAWEKEVTVKLNSADVSIKSISPSSMVNPTLTINKSLEKGEYVLEILGTPKITENIKINSVCNIFRIIGDSAPAKVLKQEASFIYNYEDEKVYFDDPKLNFIYSSFHLQKLFNGKEISSSEISDDYSSAKIKLIDNSTNPAVSLPEIDTWGSLGYETWAMSASLESSSEYLLMEKDGYCIEIDRQKTSDRQEYIIRIQENKLNKDCKLIFRE